MPELDPTATDRAGNHVTAEDDADEDLADAYEALEEDRRRQEEERNAAAEESPDEAGDSDEQARDDAEPVLEQPEESQVQAESTGIPEATSDQPPASSGSAAAPAGTPGRRVFVIDGREYPDPDAQLPITGTRSVQAMYRDYFPGQLDNADVAQKTRSDGALEVTFKRRIGTKGTRARPRRRASTGGGEVAISIAGVVGVLETLHPDRPLAWDLVEQAIDARGRVRLDFIPPAAQLKLAEAQQTARARLIEQSVAELRSWAQSARR
jgi:hypothetical protein